MSGSAEPGATIAARFAEVARVHPGRSAVLGDSADGAGGAGRADSAGGAGRADSAGGAGRADSAGGAGRADLTYRELASWAAAVAAAVAAACPGGGQDQARPVAVLCRHGAPTIAALLGALAAGHAYVPLDPTLPRDRLALILADSGAVAVLADAPHADLAGEIGPVPVVPVPDPSTVGTAVLENRARPDDPAYLLYTSGSTGEPKGVVHSHRSVLASVAAHAGGLGVGPADRVSVLTSFAYDMSVTDMFSALFTGAAVVPVDLRSRGLAALAPALTDRGVTVYHSTPTTFRYLLAGLEPGRRLPALRAVVLGGEEVTRADLTAARERCSPDLVFVNGYGTTEISFAAQEHLPAGVDPAGAVVPIGRPMDGVEIVLLDGDGEPAGEGEVLVVSERVALGYHNRPDLTAERFVTWRGRKAYRTGDLARWLPGGRLAYLGRADRQVKIRGYRVEPGEVEAALVGLPGVAQAAVVARPRPGGLGEYEILAYVVPAGPVDPDGLRASLAASLPDHLVPRVVVPIDAVPVGPTGKLDTTALPSPDIPTDAATDAPAGSTVEDLVARLWAEALGVPEVDRTARLGDLGAHSLLMGLVQQRLQDALGRPVPITSLYAHPTVASLAGHLTAQEHAHVVTTHRATDDGLIAIVGLAARVPGAPDAATLWRNLCDGVESVRTFDPSTVDDDVVPAFGYLDDLEGVDLDVFGMRPDEAALTDPQQRLFLEVAWAALEDAGHDPGRDDAVVGVFAGSGANRYLRHHLLGNPAVPRAGDSAQDWDDALVGHTPDYLPAQTAYRLGLTGPAVAVQTACSSSLVAVCVAAQNLLDHRCDVAVAGGAAVVSTTQHGYRWRAGGTLAPDGRCRPFDAESGGQVFGNGAGAVVLKRLDDARADGDDVVAVLAGWAVNNDGAARAGFATPGPDGQATVVAEALADADVDPASVGYVEAHGTGTPVGDAIEAGALVRVFGRGSREVPGLVGSAKGNLGNLDAAAGVVGLIKAALAVRTGVVPPTVNVKRPQPDLVDGPLRVATELTPWPAIDGPRHAGVSSFGLGGTNAHVVLTSTGYTADTADAEGPVLLVLSAATPEALVATADRLADRLGDDDAPRLVDVAYTLARRRMLAHRAAVRCDDRADAVEALRDLADGRGFEPFTCTATAWLGGERVDAAGCGAAAGRHVSLPPYPFRRTRHWLDPVS